MPIRIPVAMLLPMAKARIAIASTASGSTPSSWSPSAGIVTPALSPQQLMRDGEHDTEDGAYGEQCAQRVRNASCENHDDPHDGRSNRKQEIDQGPLLDLAQVVENRARDGQQGQSSHGRQRETKPGFHDRASFRSARPVRKP
jgi:hypothetical protein